MFASLFPRNLNEKFASFIRAKKSRKSLMFASFFPRNLNEKFAFFIHAKKESQRTICVLFCSESRVYRHTEHFPKVRVNLLNRT